MLSHLNPGDPILVGFSGGDDSLVLLHVLRHCPFEIHLAHFDHGWRESSSEEAGRLEALAEQSGIPFFLGRDQPKEKSEEEAREKRYAFFEELYRGGGYRALVLAHHKEDQAETILKRLFEGAQLSALAGMKEAIERNGMLLLRPLLAISKRELKAVGLLGIQDSTNGDHRFLRARMRGALFPHLDQLFGKQVKNSLIRVGKYAEEIEELLREATYSTLRGPMGLLVEDLPKKKALLRYALHQILKGEGLSISESLISQIMEKIALNKANCFMHPRIYIDRGRLFVLSGVPPKLKIEWTELPEAEKVGWKEVWKGRVCLNIPDKERIKLLPSTPILPKMDKLWTEKKIPAILRGLLPLVSDGEAVIGDFLSGQKVSGQCKFSILIEIVSG